MKEIPKANPAPTIKPGSNHSSKPTTPGKVIKGKTLENLEALKNRAASPIKQARTPIHSQKPLSDKLLTN